MWNHLHTVGNRTNNHLEGYNKKLKNFFGAKSPNIFKSIQYFQLEEANAALRYFRADNEDSNINRPPRRAYLDLVKEAKLVTLAELYKDGVITYNVFVDKVINFYDFNRAKLVRMSEDGEESDDISSSESETEDN